jgi:hypothetical protein
MHHLILRHVHSTSLSVAQLGLGQIMNHSCGIHLPFHFTLVSNKSCDTVNNVLCQGILAAAIILVIVLAWQETSQG